MISFRIVSQCFNEHVSACVCLCVFACVCFNYFFRICGLQLRDLKQKPKDIKKTRKKQQNTHTCNQHTHTHTTIKCIQPYMQPYTHPKQKKQKNNNSNFFFAFPKIFFCISLCCIHQNILFNPSIHPSMHL